MRQRNYNVAKNSCSFFPLPRVHTTQRARYIPINTMAFNLTDFVRQLSSASGRSRHKEMTSLKGGGTIWWQRTILRWQHYGLQHWAVWEGVLSPCLEATAISKLVGFVLHSLSGPTSSIAKWQRGREGPTALKGHLQKMSCKKSSNTRHIH